MFNRFLQISRNCRAVCRSVQRRRISSKPSSARVWSNSAILALGRQNGSSCLSPAVSTGGLRLSNHPLVSLFYRGYADLPDHKVLGLPALSPTMSTGTIVSWEIAEGDEVMDGDVLARIETDKATMDMDSPMSGYVAKIVMPEGSKDLPIGKPVCILVENEEDIAAFKDYQPPADDTTPTPTPSAQPEDIAPAPPPTATPPPPSPASQPSPPPLSSPTPRQAVGSGAAGRVFASPFAKTLAAEKGIDIKNVQGSGAGGRIVSRDILGAEQVAPAASGAPESAHYDRIDLSNMRKTIARRLQESKRDVPHYYLTVDIIMDEALTLRQDLNAQAQGEYKLSVNDFIIKAAALSMNKVPEVNSSWEEDHIRQYKQVDVSVAVSTDGGLITPIVFGAEAKGLRVISKTVTELANKARDGNLQPHEFVGGTFTISNLGMYGIKQFTAIINPPQACILAVGATENRVIIDESCISGYCKAKVMTVTMSCDHRVVDGAVGARWLGVFKSLLEKPSSMLL